VAAAPCVVDADVHCAVPSIDALYPYLTGHWADFLPQTEVAKHHAGRWSYPSWSTMLATEPKDLTLDRLREQALDRVDAAVLNCHFGIDSIQHPDLAAELQRGLNTWLREEWLNRDERLLGTIAINPNYAQAAIQEIERVAADPRFVQVALPVRSREAYGNPRYWPIWETAARHDLVLALTYGGSAGMPPTTVNWTGSFFEDYVVHTLNFATQIMSLIVSGVLQKWPNLRFTVVESGWAWVPGFAWRMDAEWKSHYREVPWVEDAPSAYMRRFFRFTTQPSDLPDEPEQIRQALEQLGDEQCGAHELLLHSSDYPHRYEAGVERILECLTSDQAACVMGANAWDWYRLDRRADGERHD
jgi:predicted TIM-barrel fold metal-dependent hydrolase